MSGFVSRFSFLYLPGQASARPVKLKSHRQERCLSSSANLIGRDGNDLDYSGDSTLYDAWGDELVNAQSAAGCFTHTLSYQALRKVRKQFPAHLDADEFELRVRDER